MPLPLGPRRWYRLLVPAVAVLFAAACGMATPPLVDALRPERRVWVYGVAPQPLQLETREQTVAAALDQAGIRLAEGDRVTPAPDTALAGDSHVYVTHAVPVVLRVEGEEIRLRSAAGQVGNLLAEQGVALGSRDRVDPDPATPLTPGLAIRVVRMTEQVRTETREVPFATEYRNDPNLPLGQTRVMREGRPGVRELAYRQVYRDGKLVRTEPAGERVVQPPVSQVVARGTVGVVARGGQTYRYRQELRMVATAYSPGDGMTPGTITATGIPARRGVVAVDPRVIPLGTRVYVEGYGVALAADTGGAIKGKRIDLAFDTPAEARRFGRKTVRVYVLLD